MKKTYNKINKNNKQNVDNAHKTGYIENNKKSC